MLTIYRDGHEFNKFHDVRTGPDREWEKLRKIIFKYHNWIHPIDATDLKTHEDIVKRAEEDVELHEWVIRELPIEETPGKFKFYKPPREVD